MLTMSRQKARDRIVARAQAAIRLFQKGRATDPERELGWLAQWRLRRLLRTLDELAASNPKDLESMYLAGVVLRLLSRYREALERLVTVHAAEPDEPTVARETAWCAIEIDDPRFASAVAREALETSPRRGDLHYVLGVALLLQGKPRLAEEALWKAASGADHAPDATGEAILFVRAVRAGAVQCPRTARELFGNRVPL
jgi:predicted Zn-dependent protease